MRTMIPVHQKQLYLLGRGGDFPFIDIERYKNRLLKFCYVPATSSAHNRLLFVLRPFTVLMKQTRQAVLIIKQSIFLDVYVSLLLVYLHLFNGYEKIRLFENVFLLFSLSTEMSKTNVIKLFLHVIYSFWRSLS
jgi:hypothetical protein